MEDAPITSKTIAYMVFGFIFVGFGILLFFIMTKETIDIVDIPENLERDILIQRFLSSPDCFTYQDKETLRFYPGIIDLEKFTQENFDKEDNQCYKIEEDTKAPQFRLIIGNKIVKTSDFEGKVINKKILIFKEGKFENAILKIEYEIK